MDMANDLISGAENAAKYLGLPRRTIYNLVEQGHLPVVRKGKRLFFLKSSLQRAFSSNAQ